MGKYRITFSASSSHEALLDRVASTLGVRYGAAPSLCIRLTHHEGLDRERRELLRAKHGDLVALPLWIELDRRIEAKLSRRDWCRLHRLASHLRSDAEYAMRVAIESVGIRLTPKRRSECEDGHRPCPFSRCRYHLRLRRGQDNCALDVAMKGGVVLPEIGDTMGINREWVRKIANRALKKIGQEHPDMSRFLEGFEGWSEPDDYVVAVDIKWTPKELANIRKIRHPRPFGRGRRLQYGAGETEKKRRKSAPGNTRPTGKA